MSTQPMDALELRALEQRNRLHNSVTELKVQVRDKLDVKKNARKHLLAVSVLVSGVGLLLGNGRNIYPPLSLNPDGPP